VLEELTADDEYGAAWSRRAAAIVGLCVMIVNPATSERIDNRTSRRAAIQDHRAAPPPGPIRAGATAATRRLLPGANVMRAA